MRKPRIQEEIWLNSEPGSCCLLTLASSSVLFQTVYDKESVPPTLDVTDQFLDEIKQREFQKSKIIDIQNPSPYF